jgi:hypothetical protein
MSKTHLVINETILGGRPESEISSIPEKDDIESTHTICRNQHSINMS